MMKNFLLEIDGASAEDLTTEILRFILENEDYAIYQRIFYNFVFKNNENKTTADYGFRILTQQRFNEYGIPDLMIQGDDEVYIFENKFYAPYSGDNQISRYMNILNNHYKDYKTKKIFLLTIANKKNYYQAKIEEDIKKQNNDFVKIEYAFIIWDEILNLFKSGDFIISNLIEYITNKYLVETKFSDKEITVLNNIEIPTAINKVFIKINEIRDGIKDDYITNRMSQSKSYYGFPIKLKVQKKFFEIWFGYFLPLWEKPVDEKIITPLYMQIRKGWSDNKSFNLTLLKDLGYKYTESEEWVKPYEVALLKNDKITETITNDIMEIEKKLLTNSAQ